MRLGSSRLLPASRLILFRLLIFSLIHLLAACIAVPTPDPTPTPIPPAEEAIDNMRAGEVYDVVVMESRFIPLLAAGRVGLWMGQRREVISFTLKSLGYSANSEAPAELEEALERLIKLKPDVLTLEEHDLYTSAELLANGKLVISMGYADDVIASSEQNPSVHYVLPQEGALLWNDTFISQPTAPTSTRRNYF